MFFTWGLKIPCQNEAILPSDVWFRDQRASLSCEASVQILREACFPASGTYAQGLFHTLCRSKLGFATQCIRQEARASHLLHFYPTIPPKNSRSICGSVPSAILFTIL